MMTNYEKLKALLRELFQMDQADLDFGLYRIMNAKRDEIEKFLEHDLLPQVRAELARHTSLDSGVKKSELDEAIENANRLGVNPDAVPKVQQLREELKQGADLDALENEVFSHLCNFFRRYYHQGDFLSLRRYKEGVYAIPYEGEEVKLCWANHDQYYIKSTEYLRNYTFRLRDKRRVHFKVVEANTEANNNKTPNGNHLFSSSTFKVEDMFGCKASDIPIRIARKGIDKSLKTDTVSLEFDSGKLKRIQFERNYEFRNSPQPYPEPWKNLVPVGLARISGGMPREQFLVYLKLWEERARACGAESVEAGEDLGSEQYSVGIVQESLEGFSLDLIALNMGPSRRAGGGGLWSDGWCLFFARELDHNETGVEVGRLLSLAAFRDEFNTVARRTTSSPQS
jgi:hypothetical protein